MREQLFDCVAHVMVRAVDAVGGVVAVRCEHLPQRRAEPAAAAVVSVSVSVVVPMLKRGCGLARGSCAFSRLR
jgi:hypothetical protein